MMEQPDTCKTPSQSHIYCIPQSHCRRARSRRAGLYIPPALMSARSMLSPNGKKASEPRVTPLIWSNQARFSSLVNTGGFTFEYLLPCAFAEYVHIFFTDIHINRIVPVCSSYTIHKFQVQNLGSLTQVPVIGFLACKSGTVYSDCWPALTPMA